MPEKLALRINDLDDEIFQLVIDSRDNFEAMKKLTERISDAQYTCVLNLQHLINRLTNDSLFNRAVMNVLSKNLTIKEGDSEDEDSEDEDSEDEDSEDEDSEDEDSEDEDSEDEELSAALAIA